MPPGRAYWTRDDLQRTRELCEKHGIALEMVALPLLASSHIDREKQGGILLGQEPERSRDIERVQKMTSPNGKPPGTTPTRSSPTRYSSTPPTTTTD